MSTILVHHGIDGQKWGQRNGPPYPLGYEQHSEEQISKASSSEKKRWRLIKTPEEKLQKIKEKGKIEAAKNKNKIDREKEKTKLEAIKNERKISDANAKKAKAEADAYASLAKYLKDKKNVEKFISSKSDTKISGFNDDNKNKKFDNKENKTNNNNNKNINNNNNNKNNNGNKTSFVGSLIRDLGRDYIHNLPSIMEADSKSVLNNSTANYTNSKARHLNSLTDIQEVTFRDSKDSTIAKSRMDRELDAFYTIADTTSKLHGSNNTSTISIGKGKKKH